MESSRIDYYAVFGLAPDADADTIKKVFLEKAHLLVEAYQVLTNASAREQYDLSRQFHAPQLLRDTTAVVPTVPFGSLKSAGYAEDALKRLVVSLDGRKLIPGTKINKRLLSRIPVDRAVALRLTDGAWHEARLQDLSGSGARIMASIDLRPDDVIEMSTSQESLPFVLAQVVRVVKAKQEFGVKWLKVFENELPKGFFSNRLF